MKNTNYIRGALDALHLFKVANTVGLSALSTIGGIGAKAGDPLDTDRTRRKNTIDRAFSTNDTLPSASSSTEEAPMRSP